MSGNGGDPTLEYISSNMNQGVSSSGRQPFAVLIRNLPQLEVLRIEFEAEVKKRDQLAVVVDRAKGWKFPREDGSHLCWNGEVKESKWEGLAHPVEEDEEYNSSGDEDSQGIHTDNAEDVGNNSRTEDRTETLQPTDTLQPAETTQPTKTPQLTHVVAVLTFGPVKCSTTLSRINSSLFGKICN
jgi:hypothetical protein